MSVLAHIFCVCLRSVVGEEDASQMKRHRQETTADANRTGYEERKGLFSR